MSTYAVQKLKALEISDISAYKVAKKLTRASYVAGESVWPTRNSFLAWRLVVNGILAVVTPSSNGSMEAQNLYGPDTWVGEHSIINADHSYIEYVCVTDVELLNMPAVVFLQLLDRETRFAKKIALVSKLRAQHNAEMLVLMRTGNSNLRMLIGLGMFFEAVASKTNRLKADHQVDSIPIAVKLNTLPNLLGVSPAFFWGNLKRLEHDGWLKVHNDKLELLDLATWRGVTRRRREYHFTKTAPTIEELLAEFRHEGMTNAQAVR